MPNPYFQAIGLGVIAGMRSMAAPALTSDHYAKQPSTALTASPLKGLGLPLTARVLKLMALGELGVDKLPGVPNRTDPGPLGARAVSGGLCGAVVFLANGRRPIVGAAFGAFAAAASAFAFFHLRKKLGQETTLPDYVLAGAEDALALAIDRGVFAKKCA